MNQRSALEASLKTHRKLLGAVIHGLRSDTVQRLDFTARNTALAHVDLKDTKVFDQWLSGVLRGQIGMGGFMEDRVVYRRSEHFAGEEARRIHLGVDLWMAAGTPVYAPFEGAVHSFQDNADFGNYGPTIILEHTLADQPFYSLYGHLSRSSLESLVVGQAIPTNGQVGEIGPYPENGDWPPHLHFQAMTDLLGWFGDFPGVVAPSQQAAYAEICIDPKFLLRIE